MMFQICDDLRTRVLACADTTSSDFCVPHSELDDLVIDIMSRLEYMETLETSSHENPDNVISDESEKPRAEALQELKTLKNVVRLQQEFGVFDECMGSGRWEKCIESYQAAKRITEEIERSK